MKHISCHAVVLSRFNFGEADKILTLITPDHGKLRVIAKGARRVKSKLAGGIELFSISNITIIKGKNDISTLVSTRLQTHYDKIVEDIDRIMLGYKILKIIDKATQDACDKEYYLLVVRSLAYLNNTALEPPLIRCWFVAHLLQLQGHTPNLLTDVNGQKLHENKLYQFDYHEMRFYEHEHGSFTANHIKLLRLLLQEEPERLLIIKKIMPMLPLVDGLLQQSLAQYIAIDK